MQISVRASLNDASQLLLNKTPVIQSIGSATFRCTWSQTDAARDEPVWKCYLHGGASPSKVDGDIYRLRDACRDERS